MSESRKKWAAIGRAARTVALPNGTPCDAAHLIERYAYSKPKSGDIASPGDGSARSQSMQTRPTEMRSIAKPAIANVERCDPRPAAHQGAPPRTMARPPTRVEQTNPNRVQRCGLTTRQLAAARLVVQGMSCAQVAASIGVIRQTVGRWKIIPAFDAEVRRLHEILLIASLGAPNSTHQMTNESQIQMGAKSKRSARPGSEI
jgi:hypothetical protein